MNKQDMVKKYNELVESQRTGCQDCHQCDNCTNCTGCHNCLLCVGMLNKRKGYWLLNKQVSNEEFEQAKKEYTS